MSERKDLGVAVATPWGEASELRERRLYPGAGTPPEDVARNQRERLFAAAVAVASQKGYEAMTVADILSLSGVSRSAFYKHFGDKAECLTAAASELLEPTIQKLDPGAGDNSPRDPSAALAGFLGLVDSQPAAARVCFVELHAAGKAGEAVADRAFESLADAIEKRGGPTWHPGAGPELTRALLAGMRKLIHTRLIRGKGSKLTGLEPELCRWLELVVPPPRPLQRPRRQRPAGGPRFTGYTPGERIAHAVAAVIAEKGYGEMSTDDIAAQAGISLSTFYAHFSDKRDAVLGALEMSGAQVTALAVPAARRADSWQEGVRALYEAICTYFAAEPEMAKLATIGVYGAGGRALARRDRVIDSLTEMLAPGFHESPEAPVISAEAIGASVYALMREQVRSKGPESLPSVVPLATYITLVAFVGPERALIVANGEGRR